MKVLVVDDKLELRRWLRELLEKQGYIVKTVTEGASALTELRRHKFDLVLTDTKMPCLTGPELLAEMKLRNITIPVIGMSSLKVSRQYYDYFWHKKQPPAKLFGLITRLTAEVVGN